MGSGHVWQTLEALLGRAHFGAVSREHCHRLTLDVKGVAARARANSLALQVAHITGLAQCEFAWRVVGTQADIWYWDSARFSTSEHLRACPEMLLRPPLGDALSLLKCQTGVEAVRQHGQRVVRSRWFEQMPSDHQWQTFVRDAGLDPTAAGRPELVSPVLGHRLARGWRLHSTMQTPRPHGRALWLTALALGGGLVCALVAYQILLTRQVEQLRQAHRTEVQASSEVLGLQQQMDLQLAELELVARLAPKALQTRLLAALADGNLLDVHGAVSLLEWEYRNGRVRMQFSVPLEGFSLADFLQDVERLEFLQEVRLMPGTPGGVVAVQGTLRAPADEVRGKS